MKIALLLMALWFDVNLASAQPLGDSPIKISINGARRSVVVIDANLDEATVRIKSDTAVHSLSLRAGDIHVTDGDRAAEVLSVDSITLRANPRMTLSIVADNSASMFGAYDSLACYLDSTLRKLPAGGRYSAYIFDNIERTSEHFSTARGNVWIAPLFFTSSRDSLSDFLHFYDSIRVGFTPLYDAISVAARNASSFRQLSGEDGEDVIVAISDGSDNASRMSIEWLHDVVRSSGTRLYSINFRTEPDGRLLWLARRTNGEYYYAGTLSELSETLEGIATRLARGYRIRYRFPPPGPSVPGGSSGTEE